MKKTYIKKHLKEYSIYNKRKTTINHAFASALAIADNYDEDKINCALKILKQDPNNDLECAYCANPAETWDHIHALVKDGEFSGNGHQINNLLPCCKQCNSKKGNKDWQTFLADEKLNTKERVTRIKQYIQQDTIDYLNILDDCSKIELENFKNVKKQIFDLLKEADDIAISIRYKLRTKTVPNKS